MRSKHEIFNKTDYMQAYSFNLILTERTNSELEHENNVGKIDAAFYRNFSWQIMGKKKSRQLSDIEPKDVVQARHEKLSSEALVVSNGRLPKASSSHADIEEKIIDSRTDLRGTAAKRYTTTCYFKPKTIPAWYTESLLIFIGSTKRRFDEKVWFKHKLQPYYWSENMTTEVNVPPTKSHISEVVISTEQSDVHYMSLEPQQELVASAS